MKNDKKRCKKAIALFSRLLFLNVEVIIISYTPLYRGYIKKKDIVENRNNIYDRFKRDMDFLYGSICKVKAL